jgi:hypothetical protein
VASRLLYIQTQNITATNKQAVPFMVVLAPTVVVTAISRNVIAVTTIVPVRIYI